MKRGVLFSAAPIVAAVLLTGCEQVAVNRLDQPDVLLRGTQIVPVVPLTLREKEALRAAKIAAEEEAAAQAEAAAAAALPTDPTDGPIPGQAQTVRVEPVSSSAAMASKGKATVILPRGLKVKMPADVAINCARAVGVTGPITVEGSGSRFTAREVNLIQTSNISDSQLAASQRCMTTSVAQAQAQNSDQPL